MGEITKIEQYAIDRVREKRKELGISQVDLAQQINMNESFIAHAETTKRRTKYNLNHLNEIAKVLQCSPQDFLPKRPI